MKNLEQKFKENTSLWMELIDQTKATNTELAYEKDMNDFLNLRIKNLESMLKEVTKENDKLKKDNEYLKEMYDDLKHKFFG